MTKQEKFEHAVAQISMGQIIDVADASWLANDVCIGDFRDIGWSKRVSTRSSLYYRWDGPTAIRVDGVLIEPGCSTTKEEMDWS